MVNLTTSIPGLIAASATSTIVLARGVQFTKRITFSLASCNLSIAFAVSVKCLSPETKAPPCSTLCYRCDRETANPTSDIVSCAKCCAGLFARHARDPVEHRDALDRPALGRQVAAPRLCNAGSSRGISTCPRS